MAGWSEIVLVLALALILFGPKRLPEIAEAAGKSIRKFKSALFLLNGTSEGPPFMAKQFTFNQFSW